MKLGHRESVILGLNYFFHDSSACLVEHGVLLAALEEERFTRVKHTNAFPLEAIKECLQLANRSLSDVTDVAVSIDPAKHVITKAWYGIGLAPNFGGFFQHEFLAAWRKQRSFWAWLRSNWPDQRAMPRIHFIPHHAAHAVGSFLISPFETAAVMSLDGSGEWSTSMLAHGQGTKVRVLSESFFPNSLGSLYEAVTDFIGFKPNYDEGKTMGLAPFGDPAAYFADVSRVARLDHRGRIELDLGWFNFQSISEPRYGRKFIEHFGPPRKATEELEQRHKDAAATFQRVLEERGLELARLLHTKTGEKNLVISGGVALNSVMNGRILRETPFEDVYIMSAAGDSGTSIGAAFVAYNTIVGGPREYVHLDASLGTAYDDASIERALKAGKLPFKRVQDVALESARLLHARKIVGWFQGRMEIGPRALGCRSILADPTDPGMKDRLNAEVKHREAFRPFAPSIVTEERNQYFDIGVEDPFMSKVCSVLPSKRALLPAITHVDGTARLQTVSRDTNPLFHRLIDEFGKLSGVPVILNTSFNIMGEPIVESPTSALRCFYTTGLDALAIGSFILTKT